MIISKKNQGKNRENNTNRELREQKIKFCTFQIASYKQKSH